ncbi:transcription initiation factor IIB-like [Oryza brachyantha]|uniref:transcription initiation factor IIB-like n=1 Tax=Oryza brachyantha TaxID=4533 RepID=UPI001ADBAB79|nr:transcription initiation factor IIB-like [Oryza brachyantha]
MHNVAAARDDGFYCPDCHRATAVVVDHATGDTICTECALVLEAHYIDETSEWRTLGNDGGGSDDRDPNRVGDRSDPFLPDQVGGTTITYSGPLRRQAKNAGGEGAPLTMRRIDVGVSTEKTLVAAFKAIADMADRLGLVATIRDRAKEVFKKLDETPKGFPKGRHRDAIYAACLFVACRNEGMPRTYKELASVTAEGAAAKKEIGRLTTLIKRHLGEEEGKAMDLGVVRASDYLRRFGSRLGLGHGEVRAAQAAVRRVEEGALDVRRNPESIAAAIIYMVAQRAGGRKSVRDVSTATGVAEATISAAQKELAPHARTLFG